MDSQRVLRLSRRRESFLQENGNDEEVGRFMNDLIGVDGFR
jgi:hypothetical protein